MMGLTNLTQCDSVLEISPQSDQVLKKGLQKGLGAGQGWYLGRYSANIFFIIIFSFFSSSPWFTSRLGIEIFLTAGNISQFLARCGARPQQ